MNMAQFNIGDVVIVHKPKIGWSRLMDGYDKKITKITALTSGKFFDDPTYAMLDGCGVTWFDTDWLERVDEPGDDIKVHSGNLSLLWFGGE